MRRTIRYLDFTPHPASGLSRNADESGKDSSSEPGADDTDTGEGSEDPGEPAGERLETSGSGNLTRDHWTPSGRSPTPIPTQNDQIPETKKQVKRDPEKGFQKMSSI